MLLDKIKKLEETIEQKDVKIDELHDDLNEEKRTNNDLKIVIEDKDQEIEDLKRQIDEFKNSQRDEDNSPAVVQHPPQPENEDVKPELANRKVQTKGEFHKL